MSARPDPDLRAAPYGHRHASIYGALGVPIIINAAGTNTRLSGGMMDAAVTAAMADAATACVEMPDLQACGVARHRGATGAEAGIVTCGAAAALLLGAAACLRAARPGGDGCAAGRHGARRVRHGPQPAQHVRPRPAHRRRPHRGGRIPDRFSGAGVRDATAGEIAAVIGPRTGRRALGRAALERAGAAGCPCASRGRRACRCWWMPRRSCRHRPTCGASSRRARTSSASRAEGHRRAAGERHPGGAARPGRLGAAADARPRPAEAQFRLPAEFAEQVALPFLPQHGIGRACKAGKEEIVGLLVALLRFAAEGDAARSARAARAARGGAGRDGGRDLRDRGGFRAAAAAAGCPTRRRRRPRKALRAAGPPSMSTRAGCATACWW
jgi:L-seryl-tRNA(Ser) seleniumtransferase